MNAKVATRMAGTRNLRSVTSNWSNGITLINHNPTRNDSVLRNNTVNINSHPPRNACAAGSEIDIMQAIGMNNAKRRSRYDIGMPAKLCPMKTRQPIAPCTGQYVAGSETATAITVKASRSFPRGGMRWQIDWRRP